MLSSLLFVASLLPQGPGFTLAVNDPGSHGAVGDSLLSLDEAIRVANGTLAPTSLSTAEQAQVSGTGPTVRLIEVDTARTPTITLQSLLTPILGSPAQPHLHVGSHHAHGSSLPIIQGGSQPYAFAVRTYNCQIHGLRIVGGQVGVDVDIQPSGLPAGHMAEVMACELSGQTTAGVKAHGSGTAESMVMLMHCELENMPVGFLIEDNTAGGMVMIEAERVHLDNVALGCRVIENGQGGNMSMFNLFRSEFHNGATLAELRRSTTGAQQFMFRIVHSVAHCTGNVVDVEGSAAGLTMFHHHHSDFEAGVGQKAFWVYPRTAEFDIHGSEMHFDGDVSIAANLASLRIWQQNCHYHGGTITLDVDGALPNLLWNHYENCTFAVPTTARSPVAMRQSQLINTTVTGNSFLAPITLSGCMRSGGSLSGFASESQAAPTMFLGTTEVTPVAPQIGTSITLSTDLPAGIGVIWDLALSYERPNTTLEPVRFYGDPSTVIILPGMHVLQSQVLVPIPNDPILDGLEIYAQAIALPMAGQAHVPAYHLPRGGLVQIQL
jgi:hypothetical protein